MTEREIERLAELISIKTADRYLEITKKVIAGAIRMHSSECEVGKYRKITAAVSAAVGGIVVVAVNWVAKKF